MQFARALRLAALWRAGGASSIQERPDIDTDNYIIGAMTHKLDRRPILRMNGIGNEILVLDLRGADIALKPEEARAIARQPGLKFDQLMVLHDPREVGADAALRIYNTDGSLSAACGNGTRCVAYALARNGGPAQLRLETDAGLVQSWREGETLFTVDMGRPRLSAPEIPLARDVGDTRDVLLEPKVDGAPERFSAVSMGNPHAVFFVPEASAIDLEKLGPVLERHPLFPQRANVSFAQILPRGEILLRVWERGTGATRACGSAACATLVAAARTGRMDRKATVKLPGGDLVIDWRDDDHVWMTGPVEFEFETTLDPRIFKDLTA
jgi:diaminopimelate epimerase